MPLARRISVILIIMLLLIAGCTGGDSDEPEPTPDADVALANAAELISTVESFKLEIIPYGAPFDFGIDLGDGSVRVRFNRAIGQFIAPDEVGAEVSVRLGSPNIDINIYAQGDNQWYQAPLIGWINGYFAEGFNPARLLDETTGFQAMLSTLRDLEFVGRKSINGVNTDHYAAIADGVSVSNLLMLIELEGLVPVDVFINPDTGYPVRVVVDQERPAEDGETDVVTEWQVDVFDIDAEDDLSRP
jgi:hypothetical protein